MANKFRPILGFLAGMLVCGWFGSISITRAMAYDMHVSPQGKALTQMLDSMHVENRWLAGHHVHWETGLPDGRPYEKPGAHTHCSAFVAAAAYRLGIYILRPPEHSQVLLANAQVDWLRREGGPQGWRKLKTGQQAQKLANEGYFVVAAYKTLNPQKPGHIVVVRPSERNDETLREQGPQIIQASKQNFSSTTVREGFRYHPGAFERGKILYFAHAIAPERLERFR